MRTKITASIIYIALSAVPVFAKSTPAKPTIVLVHGALETSKVWEKVIAKLEHDGFRVKNIDLPGRRGNEAPMASVSLALYQRTVAEAIAQETRPVVLVGHSFGGFTISAEAEAEPNKIKTLVYVAAYIPEDGQSLLTLATADKGSELGPILTIDKEKGVASVSPAIGGALFASDAPPAVQGMVASAVVAEPLAPLATPVMLTPARFGKVDKVVIRTLRDHVVSTPFQVAMAKATLIRMQMTIDTGHTPFVTRPDALAMDIERAAR